MWFSDITLRIQDFNREKNRLCAEILISDLVVAHYLTGKIEGVTELCFTKEQEHTFIAWANKHKVASLMLKSGWKTLYPTIQKVPYYAQLVFVADHLLHQAFKKEQAQELNTAPGARLMITNGKGIEILEWENAVDFNALLTQRQGLERIQRYYDKLVKKTQSGQAMILTPKEQLSALGVVIHDAAHDEL